MPSKESKKESIRKFKERKPLVGVYALRCTATGNVWIGVSRNLEATRNRCWFALRNGMQLEKSLQEEWNAHGESSFEYEMLDALGDVHPLEVEDLLNAKRRDWLARLSAQPLR